MVVFCVLMPDHTKPNLKNRRIVAGIRAAALTISAAYLVILVVGYVFDVADVQRHHVESASYFFGAAILATVSTRRPSVAPDLRSPHPELSWLPLTLAFIAGSLVIYARSAVLGLFSDDFVLVERALSGRWFAEWEYVRPFPSALWTGSCSWRPRIRSFCMC